jgi:hypothetical protein
MHHRLYVTSFSGLSNCEFDHVKFRNSWLWGICISWCLVSVSQYIIPVSGYVLCAEDRLVAHYAVDFVEQHARFGGGGGDAGLYEQSITGGGRGQTWTPLLYYEGLRCSSPNQIHNEHMHRTEVEWFGYWSFHVQLEIKYMLTGNRSKSKH